MSDELIVVTVRSAPWSLRHDGGPRGGEARTEMMRYVIVGVIVPGVT